MEKYFTYPHQKRASNIWTKPLRYVPLVHGEEYDNGSVRFGSGNSSFFAIPTRYGSDQGKKDERYLFFDLGKDRNLTAVRSFLGQKGLSMESGIAGVVISHHHYDHTDGLLGLPKGTKVWANPSEIPRLRGELRSEGNAPRKAERLLNKFHSSVEGLDVSGLNAGWLEDFGILAIEAFGHTSGSMAIVTKDGHAYVGDLGDNRLDGSFVEPPKAMTHNMARAQQAIMEVAAELQGLDFEVKKIHPAHSGSASPAGLYDYTAHLAA